MDIFFVNSVAELSAIAEDLEATAAGSSLEDELLAMYDNLRLPLLRYAVSFGLPVQDGEDVIQETFLALFRHLQSGRPRQNLRSWVFRVTHNQALKRRMRWKNEIEGTKVEGVHPVDCDPALGPEDALLFRERQDRLLRVVQALPPNDQACLRLRAEGLRYREIAEIVGISLGSVSNSLARSLERLERMDRR
ncbi:MAG TPA: RNA polymerase sigma factor [Edaphobacter sp.]|nr:RNA polymerase sigma factor [Edaphobacter sp.]